MKYLFDYSTEMVSVAKCKMLIMGQNELFIKLYEKKMKQSDTAKSFSGNRSIVRCIICYEIRSSKENRPQSGGPGVMSDFSRHVRT